MGRAVRGVPLIANFHPVDAEGEFIPLFDGMRLERDQQEWDLTESMFNQGLWDTCGYWSPMPASCFEQTFPEHYGPRPTQDRYTPVWPTEVATGFVYYETTTEGTPLTPPFPCLEMLASWLVLTGGGRDELIHPWNAEFYKGWLETVKKELEWTDRPVKELPIRRDA